jgi:hypothetical protein
MVKTMRSKETMRISLRSTIVAAAAALVLAILPAAPAWAGVDISEFSVGSSDQQAGGHPDLTARFKVDKAGEPEVVNNVDINMPEGVFGNPGAIFRCRAAVFVANGCQPGAQAGLITIVANYEGNPNTVLGTAPIYNMQVLGDEAARMAFVVPILNVPVIMPINVRSDSDYGLQISVNAISQTVALSSAFLNIWGFPAEKEHDSERFRPGSPGSPPGCPGSLTVSCTEAPFPHSGETVRPFIDNPSLCSDQPLAVSVKITTYQDPNPTKVASTYPATIGCENQKFDPLLQAKLTTPEADAPAGLDLQLKAQQFLAGRAPSQSNLRTATLTLPEGLSINPDAADGQTSCAAVQQAHFGSILPGACPDNAKIGTVEVHTPALENPLVGSLYIGEPLPGNQYRVFMIFDGEGIHAKLVAEDQPDPATGQVTMSVSNIPQVPFEEFDLHLFASDRGLIATPTKCRVYSTESTFVPWNGSLALQHSNPSLSTNEGPGGKPCPGQVRPFNPRLVAGTSNALAGKFSAFILKLDRDDGDQFLKDVNFKMPPGFTGSLRGIGYCPEAAIAAAAVNQGRAEQANGSCPASSQVGTSNVAAGPGSHPFHAVGKMYLAGPFKGAPLSMVVITPALAGPYDYGVVVVRVALHVDPQTAQVSALSDTVPSIIGGIPIRMRSIQVNIDRQNFTINPTNCNPFSVDSQGIGAEGTVTDFSSYFQVVNCETLPFRPKMTVRMLGGRKVAKRGKNAALRFDLRTRSGDANIKALTVTLPKAVEIDQAHLGNICSEKELASKDCAGRTPIGEASTATPLLDQPIKGPVYAVSGSGGLPRLAFILDGQVKLVPRAETRSVNGGRLQTTVPVVPDAPIGHFRLNVFGGKTGYLVNTRDNCKHPPVVVIGFVAQNGKEVKQKVRTKTVCGKKAARKKRHARHAHR